MKRLVAFALCVLSVCACVPVATAADAENVPVSYQLPDSWKLIKDNGLPGGRHALVYEVTESTVLGAHPIVFLKKYKQTPGHDFSNSNPAAVAQRVIASGVVISEAEDGPNWRSYLFLGHQNDVKVIALYRIGIQDGYVAEEVFIFPMPGTKEELALLTINGQGDQQNKTVGVYAPLKSTYAVITLFNNFTKTLMINTPAPFNAKAVMARSDQKPTAVYRWLAAPAGATSAGG